MIMDIMDVSKFVKVNELQEVTSSLFFNKDGVPDPQGLFSHEIFGIPGSYDRRSRFAFIDLGGYFIHPHIYKLFVQLDKKYAKLFTGEAYFVYNPDTFSMVEISEDHPDARTGIDYFYKFYDKIKFKESESRRRSDRLDLLVKMKKEEIFITKWHVIPAFYRDMNYEKMSTNELNSFYKKLITMCASLKSMPPDDSFSYVYTKATIQTVLNGIHDHFLDLIRLKEGFLHQAVMGKNIDNGIRTLISAPSFTANRWEDMPASFTHAAVPLSQVVPAFTDFVVAWVHDWVESKIMDRSNLLVYDRKSNTIVSKNLHKSWKEDYSYDKILKQINIFSNSPEHRFNSVLLRFEDDEYLPFLFIKDDKDVEITEENKINPSSLKGLRPLTWTDLFYLAAYDVSADKHMVITRYPITDYHSEYFASIQIRSTIKTQQMLIGEKLYNQYPVIDTTVPKDKIHSLFLDSLEIFPPYIGPLGADHDGDMVCVRGLNSREANEEADKYIHSIANCIGINGSTVRRPGDVATHTLFNLTREE